MTNFSKVLAVLVTVGSLAFAGFAMVVYKSGPNWIGEATAEELSDYGFTSAGAEKPTWTAKHLVEDKAVGGSSPVLAKVVIDTWKDRNKRVNERLQAVDQALPIAKQSLQYVQQINRFDAASLRARVVELEQQVKAADEQLDMLNTQLRLKAEETEKILKTSTQRRADIMRLTSQHAELETELFRALEHHKTLRHHLTLLRNSIVVLRQRKQILQDTVGPVTPPPATTTTSTTGTASTPIGELNPSS